MSSYRWIRGLETLMKYRELKRGLYQLAVYYIEDLPAEKLDRAYNGFIMT